MIDLELTLEVIRLAPITLLCCVSLLSYYILTPDLIKPYFDIFREIGKNIRNLSFF